MGDFSFSPWGTDEAADWFASFWKDGGIEFLIKDIESFDLASERFEELRAAAYILQSLGIPYVWPATHLDRLRPTLEKTISLLEALVDSTQESSPFLDSWGNDPRAAKAVANQIAQLKSRISEIA
jgi:hypothetical protein